MCIRDSLSIFCKLPVLLRKKELGSSHQIRSFLTEYGAAVFSVRRKRYHMIAFHRCLCWKTPSKGIGGCIFVPKQDVYKRQVMDDLVCLKTGDQVPADAKILEGSLEVNESLLTGESDNPVSYTHLDVYKRQI